MNSPGRNLKNESVFNTARFLVAGIAVFIAILFLAGCGSLYEHKSDVPQLPGEVTSTLAIGDSRQKVHSMLGEPLVDAPHYGLEVYRKSGRDKGVGWVIAPWVPVPYWGDKTVVVILVVYGDRGVVSGISVESWKETSYRYEFASVDAGGLTFLNTSYKAPATLLAPAISSNKLLAMTADDDTCSLLFVMGHCPMETVILDGRKIADFPNAGQYCLVDDSLYRRAPAQFSAHRLYRTLLWMKTEPGTHDVRVGQRLRSDDFEKTFECRSGETVYIELQGSQYIPDSWYSRRLEGSINISKGMPENTDELDGSRFILWHAGTWFGMPNGKPGQ